MSRACSRAAELHREKVCDRLAPTTRGWRVVPDLGPPGGTCFIPEVSHFRFSSHLNTDKPIPSFLAGHVYNVYAGFEIIGDMCRSRSGETLCGNKCYPEIGTLGTHKYFQLPGYIRPVLCGPTSEAISRNILHSHRTYIWYVFGRICQQMLILGRICGPGRGVGRNLPLAPVFSPRT